MGNHQEWETIKNGNHQEWETFKNGKETIKIKNGKGNNSRLGKKSQPLTHAGSVRVVGSGGLEVVVHSESQFDEECAPMLVGPFRNALRVALAEVWRSRERSIGEEIGTLSIAAEDVCIAPPERWVALRVQVDRTIR